MDDVRAGDIVEDEDLGSSDDDAMLENDIEEVAESDILPRPYTGPSENEHPKPHYLINNEPLQHFWDQYFPEKLYVRWTTFVNKLETHLSLPRGEESNDEGCSTVSKQQARYPVAPHGYGLHPNELNALFRERDGKRNLMKAVQYSLDLENTGVLSGS